MSKPSITLACIMKNEEENIPRLLDSVKDCFDEIHLTDTGSTDNSIEVAKKHGAIVHNFTWCDDFAAARNASFDKVKTDYVMWLDLDDVLENREGFLNFRNDVMGLSDYWIATYHYASDASGKAVCSFARERVFKTSKQFRWKYFVHEGIMPNSANGPIKMDFSPVWAVRHMRTEADLLKDRSRNLKLFESRVDLDARMLFYYGKELFEAGQADAAIEQLSKAIARNDLEMHDRILGMQYICFAYVQKEKYDLALQMATQGTILVPNRAEFHALVGDCFVKMGRLVDAVPAYNAAKACRIGTPQSYSEVIFNHEEMYTSYPRNQLAKIHANIGEFEFAEKEASESADKYKNAEGDLILKEIKRIKTVSTGFKDAKSCDDIVITCPPQAPYLWDGEIYRQKAMGGSETAAIEMAEWLHKLSGRPVKVFNARELAKHVNGVDYMPANTLAEYMSKNRPWVNINWRHNHKVTDAPTFVWAHDLKTPGVELHDNYIKMFCLTPFHKRYAIGTQGVPENKIYVTRNGINPERFRDGKAYNLNPYSHMKEPYRFVYGSSPDRGLDRTMRVLDKVKERYPDITLHIHYGYEHIRKCGVPHLEQLAVLLDQMIAERPWVTYHGATQQDKLMDSYKRSAFCLQPSDWIETSMISAMELICCGVYPIMRNLGGVTDTLGQAVKDGMATLVDDDCITETQYIKYIEATIDAIENERWMDVKVDPDKLSWEAVAKDWLRDLPLLIESSNIDLKGA